MGQASGLLSWRTGIRIPGARERAAPTLQIKAGGKDLPMCWANRDALAAVAAAARRSTSLPKTVIFLDQEEGGRMLPEQAAYLFAMDGGSRRGWAFFREFIAAASLSATGWTRQAGARPSRRRRTSTQHVASAAPSPDCALGLSGCLPALERLHIETATPCQSKWNCRTRRCGSTPSRPGARSSDDLPHARRPTPLTEAVL